jgi:hypothetical protein
VVQGSNEYLMDTHKHTLCTTCEQQYSHVDSGATTLRLNTGTTQPLLTCPLCAFHPRRTRVRTRANTHSIFVLKSARHEQKGQRCRFRPTCTLSQNGCGAHSSRARGCGCKPAMEKVGQDSTEAKHGPKVNNPCCPIATISGCGTNSSLVASEPLHIRTASCEAMFTRRDAPLKRCLLGT